MSSKIVDLILLALPFNVFVWSLTLFKIPLIFLFFYFVLSDFPWLDIFIELKIKSNNLKKSTFL